MYFTSIKLKKSKLLFTVLLSAAAFSGSLHAQLSGTKSIPVDYPTLAAAVADINLQGVNGPLVINIPAGFTETAPVGGYSLTATGTSANTIIFQKSGAGANPLLTAYATGAGTPGTAAQDGVFRLIGSDYVTIDGIDINDPNAANPATMEFGYALYKASTSNGCQNNTIKNCVITLNRINNAAGTAPMVDGSVGIIAMNATSAAATTVLTATTAAGSNSNNKFYSNTIQNCNIGIALIGYAASSPFTASDNGNDIGGLSSATGNTIINFGGGAVTNASAGIRTLAQQNINVSYNTINNNNGSGVNHATTLRGIYINTATSANVAVTNNTITVKSGATTSALEAIENVSGSTAASNTVTISNNVISNCTYATSTSGAFYGIYNNGATPDYLYITNNLISGLTLNAAAGSGAVNFIYNSSTINTLSSISSNTIQNITNLNTTGTVYFVYNNSSTNSYNVQNNLFSNISRTNTLAGTMYGHYNNGGGSGTVNLSSNTFTTIVAGGGSSTFYGLHSTTSSAQNVNYANNIMSNITAGTGGIYGTYNTYGNIVNMNNNIINNFTSTGTIYGLYAGSFSTTNCNSFSNTVNTLYSTGATASVYGIYVNASNTNAISNSYKNKIYDLQNNQAGGFVYGIYVSAGTTDNIYNNIIGDLKTPAANAANPLAGIYVNGGTNVNAYYNTVYLNASSTGAAFGSSAIYASTTPVLNLRNNIFINNSTPTGTGISAAFKMSSASLSNYAASSNNNLFYAGTPSATTAIFYDGTTVQQTLANFKTLVGATRDVASVTENVVFASTTGSASNFLHINNGTPTSAESGAVNIATFTDDYDADIRQGNPGYTGSGTSPDMGADEFSGVSPAPAINTALASPTGNQCTAVGRTITTNITPGAAPLTSVVLSYSFNGVAQPTVAMTGGNTTATSNWTGSMPVASPINANVTWFITTTDGSYTKTLNGTSYKDAPLLGVIADATVSVNPVCAGSPTTLSPVFSSSISMNYALPPAVTYPTSDEDFGGIIFGPLANTTTTNSLIGSIGTASGVAGSYSDFTAFGPYNFTAGNNYNMTVGSITTGTSYSNAFGVYIDYNRNGVFSDPGEAVYLSTATVSGPHTETVSITIPATAKNGLTRMRVISNEGLVTGPTMAVAYGEYEEYTLNISSAVNGGGAIPTFTAYAWTDGVTTVATTSTTIQSPVANTTYSIIATDANGCTLISTPISVTVTPLPSIPTAANSSQCGNGVSASSVSGGTNYNWYATPTSTTVLQSGSSTNYTTSIGATTSFYVTSAVGACESPRATVTTTVSQPDGVTANASALNICPSGSVTLTAVQSGTVNPYLFTWIAVPSAGSGIPTSVSGATTNVSPSVVGTYIYSVTATDGICTTTSSVSVTLNNPPSITATANPSVICSGANVNLNATTPIISTGSLTVGAGSGTSSSGGSPFYHSWGGAKVQYIYTAAELTAQGLSAGNITALGLNVTAVGIPYEGFAINAGTTAQSAFATANTINGLTQVYLGSGTNNSYLPTVGLNNFTFSTPINWNGTDNVVISICWSNATTGGSSSTVKWDTYGTNVGMYIYADSQTPSTVCSATTTIPASGGSSTTTGRPQTSFNGQIQTVGAGPLVWQWNPGAINTNTAVVNPVNTGTAQSTIVYTISASNPVTTCSNTAVVSVSVNPLPATPVAVNSSQCGLGMPTASVSGGTSYKWYATPTSTTVLQAGTSATFTTVINATTNWYVTSYNGTCESVRALLTASVTIPDAVTATSTSTAVCPGQSYTLTATKTGTVNTYNYTWTATPAVGSGIPTSATGATTAVSPLTAGTYMYLVTAIDGVCTTTASVNVTLNNPPSISASATPTAVCSSNSVTLNALSIAATSSTASTGVGSTTGITGGPYRQGAGSDNKAQYLFTAAELTAAGFAPGNITALSFNVTSNGIGSMGNFTIRMGATTSTSLATTYDAAPGVVLGPITYVTIAGLNTHTFATPFNWNGTSNVIVQVCHDVVSGGSSSSVDFESISNRAIYSNVGGACALTTGNSNTTRPIITFAGQVGTNVTSSMNFVWNPGSIPTSTAIVNPINSGSVAATQIYSVTVTNTLTGCTNSTTVGVLVNPIPVTPTAFNSTQCGVAVPTASVTGGTSYMWYATPTSTTVLQAGTSQTYTSSISTTTSFYVTSFNGNCESPRATVTASATTPDAITASVGTASICPNTTVTLTAAKIGSTNTYVYTWTAAPVAGSGIPTSVVGTSVVITPTLSGTYVYTVTGIDAGCTAVATTTLFTYSALTTPPVASALPNPICIGSSATLSATFGNTTNPVYVAPPAVTYATSDEDLGYISFGPLANTTTTNSLIGTIGTASGTAGDYSDFTAFGPYSYIKGNTYTLTVGSITTGTSYSNAFGVYIDFNRNGVFTDVGEDVYISSSTVSGPHTETTTVTIPASASTGVTRMRVISNEGLVSSPTTAVYYGEYEEYTLNLQPNITYNWTDGVSSIGTTNPLTVTPVSNTTYSFTANDGNGCTINSTAVTVTVNPLPIVNATPSSTTSCAASSVSLTASGATTYSWMPAGGTATTAVVSPTTSTIYTVTGTSLGCSSTNTVSISVTPTPTVTASASPTVICAGATVSLTAAGATNYTWTPISIMTASTTATPTLSTTYSVTGEALGCTTTKTVTVTVNHVPTLTVSPSTTLCTTGTSATLTATGTSTAYVWSNGAATASTVVTPTVNTSYSVTGTNSCGTSTATTMVSVSKTPTVSAVSSATLICANNSAVLTATGSASTYSWSTGATTTSISVTPTVTTTYTVTGTNFCGVATATVIQNVSPCTGINEVFTSSDVYIYPNPANDYINISISSYLASNNTSVEITDALGKLVMKESLNTDITTIKLSKLEDGVYFFKVMSNNQMVKIGKVVKQ